jgi:hypothetical protein
MTETESPVLSYASTREKSSLTVGGFIFQLIATAMFVGLILLSMSAVQRAKVLFEDFKLELSAPAQLTVDASDFLVDSRASIWLWILPITVPFLLSRVRREIRDRLLLIAVLLAGLSGLLAIACVQTVWDSVMTGVTMKK